MSFKWMIFTVAVFLFSLHSFSQTTLYAHAGMNTAEIRFLNYSDLDYTNVVLRFSSETPRWLTADTLSCDAIPRYSKQNALTSRRLAAHFFFYLADTSTNKDETVFLDLVVNNEIVSRTPLRIIYNKNGISSLTNSLSKREVVKSAREDAKPTRYALHQNYPNPFNPTTTIQFDLPDPAFVSVVIYDLLGREIRTLVKEFYDAGYHRVAWNGTNDEGIKISSGIYFYQFKANNVVQLLKMNVVK